MMAVPKRGAGDRTGAHLALNVAQGFYPGAYRRDLVEGPIYQGGFQDVVRLGDAGYSASITAGDVFRPRHNSLLSFNVNQTADGLWLTANPGFDQLGLFANGTSGDGLGARWQPHRTARTVA